MTATLLVIDDHAPSCKLIQALLGAEGYQVVAAHDGASGLARAEADRPELVLLDLDLPDTTGLDVLASLRAAQPDLPVVMLTANREPKTAVRAIQLGAADYLTKPIDQDEVVVVVRRALASRALQREVEDLRRQLGDGGALAIQMGSSPQARQVIEQVRTVAPSDLTVLILGETGTGKELVAQAIHRESARGRASFTAVDCGAIPEQLLESELFGHERGAFTGADRKKQGKFQIAAGGTLFLDEIGNLPTSLQAKLLRVLESRQVQPVGGARAAALDVRFVAATNDDLQARVAAGQFRADLYFRLAQYTIPLPPLRERAADVAYLAQRFLDEASVELRRPVRELEPAALQALQRHAWPGNVRELRNVIRQAVLLTKDSAIRRDVLRGLLATRSRSGAAAPIAEAAAGASLKEVADRAARAAEHHAICEALRAAGGNKSQAARALKTDYKTLHVKIKALGIRAGDFAP